MKVDFKHLFQVSEYLPLVANWIHNEFWVHIKGLNPQVFEPELLAANQTGQLPLCLLAIIETRPVGVVQLNLHDREGTHPTYSPWIGALFVCPEYRGFGIGKKLIQEVSAQLIQQGITQVFTRSHDFFLNHGFQSQGEVASLDLSSG